MEHPKTKNNTSVNMSASSQTRDPKNINNMNNISNEIESLKSEIADLKSKREQDKKNMDELKLLFQTEISKLQNQVKTLTNEIASIKSKSNKKENKNNNMNNINNDNNNINNIEENDNNMEEEEKEENDNKYSLQCLSRKLNVDIIQGTDKANIDIAIKNNSNEKYPKNSWLICDKKNSLLLCDNVELGELEPNQQKVINVWFKNLKNISKGEYKCYIKLMVENMIYSSSKIELTVNVITRLNFQNNIFPNNSESNNNPQPRNNINNLNMAFQPIPLFQNNIDNNNNNVAQFRDFFQLYDYENIPDERIKNALFVNNNDFNKAFEYLFNS